jgi:hypothetical protein
LCNRTVLDHASDHMEPMRGGFQYHEGRGRQRSPSPVLLSGSSSTLRRVTSAHSGVISRNRANSLFSRQTVK